MVLHFFYSDTLILSAHIIKPIIFLKFLIKTNVFDSIKTMFSKLVM